MPANLRPAFLWFVAALSVATGCGPAAGTLVPVSGKITIQGLPLPFGTITLVPNDDNATKPDTISRRGLGAKSQPNGTIGADGSYSLMTDGKPGAPQGIYKVTIFSIKPSTQEEGMKPPVWAASQDYSDASKSGLTLVVAEGRAAGAYNIALTKK